MIASSSSVPLENNNIRTYPGLIDPRELSPQPGTSRGISPSSLSRQHWRYVIFLNLEQLLNPSENDCYDFLVKEYVELFVVRKHYRIL